MREIKFRAWDGNRMHAAFDLTQNPLFWWQDNYDYPLMQYTGLKDKNGVEIYEGDILQCGSSETGSYRTFSIRWSSGAARFHQLPLLAPDVTEWPLCEVIGNIYENSELLKEDND